MLVPPGRAGTFRVVDPSREAVLRGQLSEAYDWTELAGHRVRLADFSSLSQPGTLCLDVDGVGESYTYQRASVPVAEATGERWARPAGHPDDEVRFHETSGRQGEDPTSSPGGWYDAGDYNEYIVNAWFSLGVMLQLLDRYPDALPDGSIDFVDADNGRGDLLDELKYELDWMLTMQDPADGGVHHKLTTLNFEGMVMPEVAQNQRFLDTAVSAYGWALLNPAVAFRNPEDVRTNEYGDDDFVDEWTWATMELYLTTRNPEFQRPRWLETIDVRFRAGETWTGYMSKLAAYSLLHAIPPADVEVDATLGYRAKWYSPVRRDVIALADSLLRVSGGYAYHQPVADWHWGSASDVLSAAKATANAHLLTGEERYLQATRQYTDWVFGYDAAGYSFVTGYGERTPMFITHRPSAADGIVAPVPGFVVGGPNTYQQDTSNSVTYAVAPGEAPMASYADQEGSYASNEVCLNWNAPLVNVLGFLVAEKK